VSDSFHFKAFSFVDRITSVQPGVSVRGSYAVPAGLTDFSSCLVAEAVGQLAAWSAMAAQDFKRRPVAGIAGQVEMFGHVQPGQLLELTADITSIDEGAIEYNGTASANGSLVLKLHNCVGPMLSIEIFDDPQALRDRYNLICSTGATPGVFNGVTVMPLENLAIEPGQVARASLQLPPEAPFFADHFPRRPVFPGSLLMQFNLQIVDQLMAKGNTGHWTLDHLSDMKLRSFIPPGESLTLEAKLTEQSDTKAAITVEARNGKRLVGAANVTLKR
jgi:3-hydroxymyristoyl/3-hydroxydecanoyl-(acyl carrier protein) dehydratase